MEFFVSSGAWAAELLGVTLDDVDWAGQRIWVVSKGTPRRADPALYPRVQPGPEGSLGGAVTAPPSDPSSRLGGRRWCGDDEEGEILAGLGVDG
ncbi:hypothetical protein MCAG_00858 [Micromonospora sp. ATCC 39149]|nr:hypothetical protein MCAG_00858 [Micromonospora sp. ATCC 39149]